MGAQPRRVMLGVMLAAASIALLSANAAAASRPLAPAAGARASDPQSCTACNQPHHPDFNGDGKADLAVSAPNGVYVLYGSSTGLRSAGSQFWSLDSTGIGGASSANDDFGGALAAGDFNHDGKDDLAIGDMWADLPTKNQYPFFQGQVTVLFGSSTGLHGTGSQRWTLNSPGVPGKASSENHFGKGLVAADFNGDGTQDLAIGFDGNTQWGGGAVDILFGGPHGLSSANAQLWSPRTPGIPGTSDSNSTFGQAMAAGDFNGDHNIDLAIGAVYSKARPSESGLPGSVTIIYGAGSGLSAKHAQLWGSGTPGILGTPESSGYFGVAVAAADFDHDGADDLAIGALYEHLPGLPDHGQGVVHVLYGAKHTNSEFGGLSATGDQIWGQDSPGILGAGAFDDEFGTSLAAGDINHDGWADLVIGSDDNTNLEFTGGVNVLFGQATGLTSFANQWYTEATTGLPGAAHADDRFGASVQLLSTRGNGYLDVVIGAPFYDYPGKDDAGRIVVLRSDDGGPSASGSSQWNAAISGASANVDTHWFGAELP